MLAFALRGPEERLDAEPVPGGDDGAGALVVQDQGELAAEVVEELGRAVVRVERDGELRVGVADEAVAMDADEVVAEAVVVVDLAVDDGVDEVVGAVDGLVGLGGEVVDGEAVVAEGCGWGEVQGRSGVSDGKGLFWMASVGIGRERYDGMRWDLPTAPSLLIHTPFASGPRWAIRSRLLLSLSSRVWRRSMWPFEVCCPSTPFPAAFGSEPLESLEVLEPFKPLGPFEPLVVVPDGVARWRAMLTVIPHMLGACALGCLFPFQFVVTREGWSGSDG